MDKERQNNGEAEIIRKKACIIKNKLNCQSWIFRKYSLKTEELVLSLPKIRLEWIKLPIYYLEWGFKYFFNYWIYVNKIHWISSDHTEDKVSSFEYMLKFRWLKTHMSNRLHETKSSNKYYMIKHENNKVI